MFSIIIMLVRVLEPCIVVSNVVAEIDHGGLVML